MGAGEIDRETGDTAFHERKASRLQSLCEYARCRCVVQRSILFFFSIHRAEEDQRLRQSVHRGAHWGLPAAGPECSVRGRGRASAASLVSVVRGSAFHWHGTNKAGALCFWFSSCCRCSVPERRQGHGNPGLLNLVLLRGLEIKAVRFLNSNAALYSPLSILKFMAFRQ
jgi:hypothetical protein